MLYIRLFHGRDDPEEVLDDWGFDGPLIGPVGITWTYGTVKLHPPSWDDMEFLPTKNGLVAYQGKFYGDFEIFSDGDPALQKWGTPQDYDTFVKNITPAQ